MIQNHALQLLTMIAMEPPSRNDADAIRDEKLKVLRSLKPFTRRERGARRRARPVPRRHRRRQAGAGLPRGSQGAAGQPHRDLRRAAHRGAELALGRRAVLPAHRQAPGGARRADRRQLPADAAHASSRASNRPNKLVIKLQPEDGLELHLLAAKGVGPVARRWRRCRSISTSTRPSPRTASAPTSGCCSTSIAGRLEPVRAQRRAGAGLALGRADPATPGAATTPAPRPYAAGTWGPAAASALVARDGYVWSEEE